MRDYPTSLETINAPRSRVSGGRFTPLRPEDFPERLHRIAIERAERRNGVWFVIGTCDCGNRADIRWSNLKSGSTKSCGCVSREGSHAIKHGATGKGGRRPGKSGRAPEYQSWSAMRGRVLNPNNPSFPLYGGRGIKICPQWDSYAQFLADMGPRPRGYSLDRIDPDGDYDPENCRWASASTQSRNTRAARIVDYHGVPVRLADLADASGVRYGLLHYRIHTLGWSAERAVSEPKRFW